MSSSGNSNEDGDSDEKKEIVRVQHYDSKTGQWSRKFPIANDCSLLEFLATCENKSNVRVFCNGCLAFTVYRNAKFTGSVAKRGEQIDLS